MYRYMLSILNADNKWLFKVIINENTSINDKTSGLNGWKYLIIIHT